ncbi:hypothetical protein [uncultured Sphingomonas sp.]|uniref:hypothetical protein n=1 Tax=uncultured Sphingomonas sp. TaxID=158754 RepID=UPI0025F81DDC|nr:hypothetical protein [uncultured Sphingomonas sp.]
MEVDRYGERRLDFAGWLLSQRDRGDWIDAIADQARRDRAFPRCGTVDDVRAHFERAHADGVALAALDHAELDYHAY